MTCTLCPLHERVRTVCVSGRLGADSTEALDIVIVGEAPGPEEDAAGTAFIGPSGRELDAWLAEAGIGKRVWITNSVRCMPCDTRGGRFRKPEPAEMSTCSDAHLWPELAALRPRVIVTVGAVPTATLLGGKPKMGSTRGRAYEVMRVLPGDTEPTTFQVVPTWHPSYILRGNKAARAEAIEDLRLAGSLVDSTISSRSRLEGNYRALMSVQAVDAWLDELLRYVDSLDASTPYVEVALDCETSHADGWGSVPNAFNPKATIVSLQLCYREGDAVLIPGEHPGSEFPPGLGVNVLARVLRTIFAHPRIGILGQNLSYDLLMIRRRFGIWPSVIAGDTMLANHALYGGSEANDLESLERAWLGVSGHKQMLEQELDRLPTEDRRLEKIPLAILVGYGCRDVDATLRIHRLIRSALAERRMLDFYHRWCVQPMWAILDIQDQGMVVDVERLADYRPRIEAEMREVEREVNALPIVRTVWAEKHKQSNPARLRYNRKTKSYDEVLTEPAWIYPDINLGSPQQLASLFFDVLHLPPARDIIEGSRDERTTDKDYLAAVSAWVAENAPGSDAEMVVSRVVRWRKVGHEWKTYIKPGGLDKWIFDDGVSPLPPTYSRWATVVRDPMPCVHPKYSQDGTVTGRLSASEPPVHGVAEKSLTAKLFSSRFRNLGLIAVSDQSQMEVRTLVSLAGETRLQEAYAQGFDVHRYVASLTWKIPMEEVTDQQRARAKTVIFGIIYGRTEHGLVADPELKLTLPEARALIEAILNEFPKLRQYIAEQHAFAWKNGYCVSPLGRYRPLPNLAKYADTYNPKDNRSPGYFDVQHNLNCAVNTPIQGVASEITMHGIGLLRRRLLDADMLTRNVGFTHDSVTNDVYVPEVRRLLPMVRAALATDNRTYFPWMTVPLVVEHKLGVSRGELCVVADEGEKWTVEGPVDHATKLFEVLARVWPVELVSWSTKEKKGKVVARTDWRVGDLA